LRVGTSSTPAAEQPNSQTAKQQNSKAAKQPNSEQPQNQKPAVATC